MDVRLRRADVHPRDPDLIPSTINDALVTTIPRASLYSYAMRSLFVVHASIWDIMLIIAGILILGYFWFKRK